MSSQTPYLSEDPGKHITTAVPFFRELGCPPGFHPVLTKDTKEGDIVYLMGAITSREFATVAHAYGPHKVIAEQHQKALKWLENQKGQKFLVNQEELLIKYQPNKETPWGQASNTTEKAPGIWFHSTSSHGGIELSPDNQTRLQTLFPTIDIVENTQWLEEDEDAYLGVLLCPTAFSSHEVSEALLSLQNRRDRKGPETFAAYLNSTTGGKALKIHGIHQKETQHLWKKGSWSTCWPKKGINLSVTHQSTGVRQFVYYEGPEPDKDYFTSEELGLIDQTQI